MRYGIGGLFSSLHNSTVNFSNQCQNSIPGHALELVQATFKLRIQHPCNMRGAQLLHNSDSLERKKTYKNVL